MKEKIKVIILLVLFIAILIFINRLLANQNASLAGNLTNLNMANNEVVKSSKSNDEKENEEDVVLKVTDETFEEEVLKESKTVLIDFYADWCGPCQVLSPIVEEVAKENQDIKVVKVNVDTEEKLAIEYGAMSIPTLVVIKDGKEVKRSVGLISKEKVIELVKE